MAIGKFELNITGKTTAYLRLPTHPGQLRGARSVPLVDVMGAYKGPYVVFDFDQGGTLVGIEIVGNDAEEDDEVEAAESGGGPTTVDARLCGLLPGRDP